MVDKVTNLVEVLEESVGKYGGNDLFGTKRGGIYKWISYAKFGAMVDKVRGGLAKMGVGRGDRVAIISDNRVEWAAAAYATYGLGAQFVPMYEKQRTREWAYILEDAGAKVAIAARTRIYKRVRPMVDEIDSLERVIDLEGDAGAEESWEMLLQAGVANPIESVRPEPDEVAGLIYTSGTTGLPKGVILTHGNFAHNVNAVRSLFDIKQSDCSLSFLPWAHSFGQTCELHCMLANGARIGLAESVTTILPNLGEVRPTLLFAVPRIFNRIYSGLHQRMAKESPARRTLFETALANANKRRELATKGQSAFLVEKQHKVFDKIVFAKIRERFGGRLRYAFSGGAALSPEVARFVDNLGIMVYEGYGLSETSPIVSANCPGARIIGSVGKALPGVEVRIEPVEHIEDPGVGEIIVYGPNVMVGYQNLPEETEAVFTEDGGFRSGDLGRMDAEGFIFITGRVKEQYKLENGKYVVPAPLEELLKLSPLVNQVMVYGDNRPYNVALVVPDHVALGRWATAQGKQASDLDALLNSDEARKLIKRDLAEYGKGFRGYEHPRKVRLIKEEFSTDNDMLTPKMSLKRRHIVKAYMGLIEEMYP